MESIPLESCKMVFISRWFLYEGGLESSLDCTWQAGNDREQY